MSALHRLYRSKVGARARAFCPVKRSKVYALGCYRGSSLFDLRPFGSNPMLTARRVLDVNARYVADPFVVYHGSELHLFCEVLNVSVSRGEIGLFSSDDGSRWVYRQIVLREPFHLSYPYVFRWENTYYMIPESGEANSVRLYEADPFPLKWSLRTTLLEGPFVDPSFFWYRDRCWLYACHGSGNELALFHACAPTGPWTVHPKNPIALSAGTARPGGRVIVTGGKVFRVAQDCQTKYGLRVRLFEVSRLSETDYEENEVVQSPILEGSGRGWNALGMHHMDAHVLEDGSWMAFVDGWTMKAVPRKKALEESFYSLRSRLQFLF